MTQKTFTEKLIDVLINGDMPSAKGAAATESGLIILTSKMTAPVCASYGSSKDMILALSSAIEQSEPLRAVIVSTVGLYAKQYPNDAYISEIKEFLK